MIIGLTGSIASGKSTVAAELAALGLPIVDADVIARAVVTPPSPVLAAIAAEFGDVLLPDGTLNREKLGAIVFHNAEQRQRLNGLIHPAIRAEMLRQRDEYRANGAELVIMDIPLLFESKLEHFVEQIVVVYVDEATQLERLMARNTLTKEEAEARIATQLSVAEKRERADFVIDNNGTLEETLQQVRQLVHEWKHASK